MLRACWTKDGLELGEAQPGPLSEGWVRLRVVANGICGTDLHLYRRLLPPQLGNVPGHEVVGQPFDGPADLVEGLYAVEPLHWCGACASCEAGNRQLCERLEVLGIQRPGGLAEWIDVPRQSLHRVAASVAPLVASLAEPFAVCVRAVHRARLESGSRVLVLGAGTIGLLAGLLARDRVQRVAITARHPHQRKAAARLGLKALSETDATLWARSYGPDVVIESVGGQAETLKQAASLCRAAGRIVVLGIFAAECPINSLELVLKELTLIGSNTYGTTPRGSEFAAGVALLSRYQSELEPLLTHQFPLTALHDAFACAEDKASGAIKVTLTPEAP